MPGFQLEFGDSFDWVTGDEDSCFVGGEFLGDGRCTGEDAVGFLIEADSATRPAGRAGAQG